jgi:hypothetical protein
MALELKEVIEKETTKKEIIRSQESKSDRKEK